MLNFKVVDNTTRVLDNPGLDLVLIKYLLSGINRILNNFAFL